MRTVLPIKAFEPFDTETICNMSRAFSEAWRILQDTNDPLAAELLANHTRETLGLQIIALAQTGVSEMEQLRDQALACLAPQDFKDAS